MTDRIANSLLTLRDEVNAAWPNRDRASDGFYGDAAHQSQGSASDHNCWIIDSNGNGVCRAFDITSDPQINPVALAEKLRQMGEAGDHRLLHFGYVIYNGHIAGYNDGRSTDRWAWRPYDGDPHTSHIHLSVTRDQQGYDATDQWTTTTQPQEDWTMADVQKVIDAINHLGGLLEGDATHPDPTHVSLRSLKADYDALKAELDRIAKKVGA